MLDVLFDTYHLYIDAASRRAVEECLSTAVSSLADAASLFKFSARLNSEARKGALAPGSAFVLVRWSSLLLQHAAAKESTWKTHGESLLMTLTGALSTSLGSTSKRSTRAAARNSGQRAVRAMAKSGAGVQVLHECISVLTKKVGAAAPENALLLGIFAGVCAGLPDRYEIVQSRKSDYLAFFVRELLGSRVRLSPHIAHALDDFFAKYATPGDIPAIASAVEKAILRAADVVLDDLISPMISALPPGLDLSEMLASKLLKPLLNSTKASTATTRDGAFRTFKIIAAGCKDENLLAKVADEILASLKTNKALSADQRVLHARMLACLPPSALQASKLVETLLSVASKETNDVVMTAEIRAAVSHLVFALENDIKVAAVDPFTKGLADKRLPIRKVWALSFADAVYALTDASLAKDATASFVDPCVPKLIDIFNEVLANPLTAVQNGLVPVACAVVGLCVDKAPKLRSLKSSSFIAKADAAERVMTLSPKPSFLLQPRIYTKLSSEEDLRWLVRALVSTIRNMAKDSTPTDVGVAWAQTLIFLILSRDATARVHDEAVTLLRTSYSSRPAQMSEILVHGIWQWCEDVELESKDSAAVLARAGREELHRVVRALCAQTVATEQAGLENFPQEQMTKLLVLCRPPLISRAPWIELCLSNGLDPGIIASSLAQDCFVQVMSVTEKPLWKTLPSFQTAAYNAAAELAFVAPETQTPLIVAQIREDLDSLRLKNVGPTEAAIFRTPEGTAFIDVLAKQQSTQQISKTSKDYDTLKWEEDLRADLAQKKGHEKKLTKDEQFKVNAQLSKEAEIRQRIAEIDDRLRRGVGMVCGLATGPPTEAEIWFASSVGLLFEAIQAGADLIIGDMAALTYLRCSDRTSARLGSTRAFVGVATLRAAGATMLPPNLLAEPLGDLVTRVLYRIRLLGEQRPFDTVTLSYLLTLVLLVLDSGGVDRDRGEEADEQMILALEFLSFHTEVLSDTRLPRQRLFECLIEAMQKHPQHFRLLKDTFSDLCRHVATSITEAETDTVIRGAIVADIPVRGVVLQAISAELELADRDFYEEIWLACHDDDQELGVIAKEIWEENALQTPLKSAEKSLHYLDASDPQLRRAAAKAVAASIQAHPAEFANVLNQLESHYTDCAKPREPELNRYGMPLKTDLSDPWESRQGIAWAFKNLAQAFPSEQIVPFMSFLVENGPLSDRSPPVRDAMVDAAVVLVTLKGQTQVESLMVLCESTLASTTSSSKSQDLVHEAVVILYGSLAQHLPPGDTRVPNVVQRLLSTLQTPSESVQYAVAQCLPPLVRASRDSATTYLQQMLDHALHSKSYAARRGAAYGLAGIVKGRGISLLRTSRVLSRLRAAAENKKDPNERQGAFLVYELLSQLLGRMFEPYTIQVVPELLAGFADASADVREACLDAAKTCFASLSSYGVQQVLPTLLQGLSEQQWRSKKGASDSLGAMAYLDPEQLAISLPDIIPPLTEVLNDSHKEVRASANRSLQRFGDVISNPEIKSQVNILLKALSDPTRYTDNALDALIKVNFIHFLDAPSLALVVRILERGLGDRSATKRKAAQIIGSLAHLTERRDLITHLPPLVAGLRIAIVDPVPTTRATASKALGSTIEKLGEEALPDLIPSLMHTLRAETGAGDRLGSAQALSEVLAGLGTTRLEETLPTILQNVSSAKATVREGFMSLFIFLPACFGQSFATYLSRIIPPILAGLADDVESIRETALRAGRLLVKNFAARSVDLLLPELERGLADDSHRIRLSSVELVGDLLFNLTGISGKTEQDEVEENANEASASLLEVLGEEKRNRVLSALYICRCDTSGLVRSAAIMVWKALVATPRTLRELIPVLAQLLIRRLASSNMEQKVIAGNALGELVRKAGEGVLATLLPTLEEELHSSTDTDARQGICIALRELIASASPESLEDYQKTLISVVRTALVDSDDDVREAAAEAFDSLQKVLGKRAVDQVLPHLLSLLRSENEAEHALSALLTLLTESTRANIILPNLLPTLLTPPISAFNARALASLAQVSGPAMNRRMPKIIDALMNNIVMCKDESLKAELDAALDAVLLSVDEYDGLNTMMSIMMTMIKHDDHRKRALADLHMASFFEKSTVDYSRYYPDLIRTLLLAFDDGDVEVVKAAWAALSALTSHLRKEEMESLVVPTRQALNQVGVAGHDLSGFSLPKGPNAVLPIFLQGLMNGSAEQRTQAALAISDLIDRTNGGALRPFVTQITGPLIRVVSERSTDLKAAILLALNNLLQKIPTFLKPFLPQLQRTFAKSLADPSSELLRSRAAKALGTLITMTPRIDPLVAELATGSKTADAGVKNAMLRALYEVVSKAGSNMSDASKNAILGLIDTEPGVGDDALNITRARLLGALIKVLPSDVAVGLIRTHVLTKDLSRASALALNSLLVDNPAIVRTEDLKAATGTTILRGIEHDQPVIADNYVLAAGKILLIGEDEHQDADSTKPLMAALAAVVPPGGSTNTRRLALVVIRTLSRHSHSTLIQPVLSTLAPPIFASVRDTAIPVKLAAEAAFLAVFRVVEEEGALFEQYMASPTGGAWLAPQQKRSMQEYFKRVATRLSSQARERKEAEGGQGGLGLSSDEVEDERELWSVGKVDLGEGSLGVD